VSPRLTSPQYDASTAIPRARGQWRSWRPGPLRVRGVPAFHAQGGRAADGVPVGLFGPLRRICPKSSSERVGYASASTFSTAFSRHAGQPHGRHAGAAEWPMRLTGRLLWACNDISTVSGLRGLAAVWIEPRTTPKQRAVMTSHLRPKPVSHRLMMPTAKQSLGRHALFPMRWSGARYARVQREHAVQGGALMSGSVVTNASAASGSDWARRPGRQQLTLKSARRCAASFIRLPVDSAGVAHRVHSCTSNTSAQLCFTWS
jgi:hypothetical protein